MASTDKCFVIAVGGTGMRCLESFTHMCAMGMFDSKEIDILTLDTDQLNGNKEKVENLVRLYNRVKSYSNEEGDANSDTFFSAKLNLYRFWTNYTDADRNNFKNISQKHVDPEGHNKLLADLFLDDNVQSFDLGHGYRAQTHLGSYLMYHGIVEAAKNLESGKNKKAEEQEFGKFFDKIAQAGDDARIFVLGSIFGGTGASSIPVIPKALDDAIRIRSNNATSLSKKSKFGATLLTKYFSFNIPDKAQKNKPGESVIADSSFFTLNSQAALQFYHKDPTVQRTYKKMYHIGWPIAPLDFSKDKDESDTITGGATQKNDCHITELLSACAAWDFFNSDKGLDVEKASYLYKSANFPNNVLNFEYNDFIGEGDNGKLFARKFGAFVSFMHIALTKNDGAGQVDGIKGFLNQFEQQSIHKYSSLDDQYTKDLNEYMQSFGYKMDNNNFVPGWLYQVRDSINGKFILEDGTYSKDAKQLDKLDIGTLFSEEQYHWEGGKWGRATRYDTFVSELVDPICESTPEQKCTNLNEKFLAHIYNAIKKSQKI